MTDEEQNVLLIKGAISELSPEDQETTAEVAEHIRRVVKQAGLAGIMALALCGAEFTKEANQ